MNEESHEVAELAGGFIHEIKNHLSTLNLNLQLLAEDFNEPQNPRDKRVKQRIDRLLNQCGKLLDVSNDFLRFTRPHDLHTEPSRVEDIVDELVDFFTPTAKAANITIKHYCTPGMSMVALDRELFSNALLNLVLNAEQAMPDGGEIVLLSRMQGNRVFVDIIDTGHGISEENMEKLFRPFHTTKPGGTGLGLPTTRKIIRAHGGELDVQSLVGRGTKFTIALPALPPALPAYTPTED